MDIIRKYFIIIIIAFIHIIQVHSSWWLLGMPTAYQSTLEMKPTTYKQQCDKLHYLVKRQKEICGVSENVLKTLGTGAKLGIEECQFQFKTQRWNCTTFNNTTNVFGGVLRTRSREKAYVYAISAAGVAFSVTRACTKGEIRECGCENRYSHSTKGKWKWGGCSEDINFGGKFSQEFVDSREDDASADGLMNLHNNEAGRRAIKSTMELLCKCHGVSGSCSMKICWRRMGAFRKIGDELLKKFEGASAVQMVSRKKKLRPPRKELKKPSKKDLVFLEESPDYCKRNESIGVLGTYGRVCNKTSYGMDGCKLLCCGRGYQTLLRSVTEKCDCKFVWCCRVECQKCNFQKEEPICN
ncbi:hypothetical protein CHUAL_008509 [Chamberlinius hualienensis]